MRDESAAAHDDAAHGQTGLRIDLEGRVAHFLFDLKAPGFVFRVPRDGFVNVSCHSF